MSSRLLWCSNPLKLSPNPNHWRKLKLNKPQSLKKLCRNNKLRRNLKLLRKNQLNQLRWKVSHISSSCLKTLTQNMSLITLKIPPKSKSTLRKMMVVSTTNHLTMIVMSIQSKEKSPFNSKPTLYLKIARTMMTIPMNSKIKCLSNPWATINKSRFRKIKCSTKPRKSSTLSPKTYKSNAKQSHRPMEARTWSTYLMNLKANKTLRSWPRMTSWPEVTRMAYQSLTSFR